MTSNRNDDEKAFFGDSLPSESDLDGWGKPHGVADNPAKGDEKVFGGKGDGMIRGWLESEIVDARLLWDGLTVKEVREKRARAESEIVGILSALYVETGVIPSVIDVSVHRWGEFTGPPLTEDVRVSFHVRLK